MTLILKQNPVEIRLTEDGSTTLYSQRFQQHYKSPKGALSEARHVFLNSSPILKRSPTWNILEIGFGAGTVLNATVQEFLKQDMTDHLHFISVENALISIQDIQIPSTSSAHTLTSLLYKKRMLQKEPGPVKAQIKVNGKTIQLSLFEATWPSQSLLEELSSFLSAPLESVFFDPFSPRVNAEAWTAVGFPFLFKILRPMGNLSTYSATTQTRKDLKEAGFLVNRIKGFAGKRHMLQAVKPEEA